MPSKVIEDIPPGHMDSDYEDALSFAGRDWRGITSDDWRRHSCAVNFLSPEAFRYYLPSLLTLTVKDPANYPDLAFESLISFLDCTPDPEYWTVGMAIRFSQLTLEELEVMKEWLVFACENLPQSGVGISAKGPGDRLGRAFDTIALLHNAAWEKKELE